MEVIRVQVVFPYPDGAFDHLQGKLGQIDFHLCLAVIAFFCGKCNPDFRGVSIQVAGGEGLRNFNGGGGIRDDGISYIEVFFLHEIDKFFSDGAAVVVQDGYQAFGVGSASRAPEHKPEKYGEYQRHYNDPDHGFFCFQEVFYMKCK